MSAIAVIIIILTVALDRITKIIVESNMALHESRVLVPGILNITYVTNTGAAFGILKGFRWLLVAVSVIAMAAIGYFLFKCIRKKKYIIAQIAAAFIIGGGIGNLIDRLLYARVTDFLDLAFVNFAIFNLADVFVCTGAGFAILSFIIYKDLMSVTE